VENNKIQTSKTNVGARKSKRETVRINRKLVSVLWDGGGKKKDLSQTHGRRKKSGLQTEETSWPQKE